MLWKSVLAGNQSIKDPSPPFKEGRIANSKPVSEMRQWLETLGRPRQACFLTLSRLEQSQRNNRPVRRKNGRDLGAASEPSPMRHGDGTPLANRRRLTKRNYAP